LYDRTGKGVWFGTWGGGVSLFDGKEGWTSYSEADGLAGNVVYSIAQDATDALWFGTNKGVSRFDGETWTTIRHGLPAPHVYSIATADDGTVWAGTKGGVTKLWSE
jgi:ligand-binding sensor domain-containing protein